MKTYTSPLSSLGQSLLCQLIGLGAGLTVRQSFSLPDPLLLAAMIVAVHGGTAFIAALFLKLSRPWRIFNLLAVPVALFYFESNLPLWPVNAALLAAVLLYVPTFWTRVPYYPTSHQMYEAVLAELPTDKNFTFVDLGSGFGGLLSFIAKHRPLATIYGYEVSPLAFFISKLRTLPHRNQISIVFQSFWGVSLKEFDFVYAFLAPPPMPEVWAKCSSEMHKGATLLINSFPVPCAHQRVVDVKDNRGTRLYIYSL